MRTKIFIPPQRKDPETGKVRSRPDLKIGVCIFCKRPNRTLLKGKNYCIESNAGIYRRPDSCYSVGIRREMRELGLEGGPEYEGE